MGKFAGDIIGGVGTLGGAALQARAQNKATEASERATREALAFSKERLAGGDADYARKLAAWEAGRNALMERYGIDIAPPAPMSPGMPVRGGSPMDQAVPRGPGGPQPAANVMSAPGVGASPMAAQPRQGMTIADMIQAKGADPYSWDRPNFGMNQQ